MSSAPITRGASPGGRRRWRTPTARCRFRTGAATPLGKEIDPKKAFDRLFAGPDTTISAAEAEKRRALRKSVLDTVVPHGDWLRARLNAADRAKVDELFTGIRTIEQELQVTPPPASGTCMKPAAPGTGLDFQTQLDYMHTLIAIAFQCDVTRVITFMMSDALSNRNLSFIPDVAAVGGEAADHTVSHHSGDPLLVAKFRAMVLWKMGQIGNFLRKLKMLTDAEGQPLLNNMLVFITSELAGRNRHNHDDISFRLADGLLWPGDARSPRPVPDQPDHQGRDLRRLSSPAQLPT
jgi:hypothetical protein